MGKYTARLWPIVKREYLERVRTRWFLIATVFAPLLFSLFIFVPAYFAMKSVRHASSSALMNVIILDATRNQIGARVAATLGDSTENGIPNVRAVRPDTLVRAESIAVHDVALHRATGYLVLDSATDAGRGARYEGRKDKSDAAMNALGAAVGAGIIEGRLTERGIDPVTADSIVTVSAPITALHISDDGKEDNPFKMLFATFVAFFLYMSIMLFGQSMLSGVIEEKTTRVSEVVISSVPPETLLAGKVIGVSAVGLTQQFIWIIISLLILSAGSSIFGTSATGSQSMSMVMNAAANISGGWITLVVLYFIFGFVFYGSLYAAVGATVSSEADARQAAQPVMMLLLLTILLVQPVIASPDSTLSRTLSILPFSAPVIMPLRMALGHVPALEVAASIVVLLLGCTGAVWMAARIYRIGLLMYGKRPTLIELGRWIRHG